MATEFQDAFNSPLTQETENLNQLGISEKFESLRQASNQKIAELEQYRLKQVARKKAVADSVVGKMGLDPDNLMGSIVNRGVATFTGVADGAGVLASGAASELARFNRSIVEMPAREAYQRQQQGIATPADLALLNKPTADFRYLSDADIAERFAKKLDQRRAEIDTAVAPDINGVKPAGLGRIAVDSGLSLVNSAIAVPEAVVGLASIVSGGAAGKLLEDAGFRPAEAKAFVNSLKSAELQASSQSVNGAEGFWNTLDQVAENPSTVPQLLLESLFPMLAGGLAARGLQALGSGVKAATAIGEGATMAGSSAEQIRQQTADKRLTLKQSLAAATTGVMGASVARLSGGVSGKLGLGDIDEAITKGTLGTSQRGLLTRTGGAAAFEGAEEGLQSTGETILQNFALDKALSEGVGNAAALGIVTGAAMGAPMGLAKGVGEAQQRYQDATKLQNDAIATGDVTALADPAARTYNPERAIAALVGNAQLGTTTDEVRQAHLAKADEILAQVQDQHDSLSSEINVTTVKGAQAQIANIESQLANTDPDNTQRVNQLTAGLQNAREALADLVPGKEDTKLSTQLEKRLAQAGEQLQDVKTARNQLANRVFSGDGLGAQIETLEAAGDTEASVAAANKIINLAMQAPELLDPVKAGELASNTANALTAPQRSFLRQFSQARLAQNFLIDKGGVSRQIYEGGDGNLGIKDYQERMQKALATGNTEQAQKQLDGLTNFEFDHLSKAQVAEQALAKGLGVQIVKENGQWKLGDGSLTKSQLRANGGLAITSSSLVSDIRQEADALTKSLGQLQAAYDLKFNSGMLGANNVQNPSQQGSGTQVQLETPAAKNAAPTRTAAGDVQGAPAATETDGLAKADGVVETTAVNEETRVSSVSTVNTESTQITETIEGKNQSNSENSTAELTAVETKATVEDGSLLAFQKKSPEGTAYKSRLNLIADFFKQSAGKEGSATQRPLVKVKNFLSAVQSNAAKVLNFVDAKATTVEQDKAWKMFMTAHKLWSPVIDQNLNARDPKTKEYFYKDMMQFLHQFAEDGTVFLEENVKTAMIYSAFSWIAENATRPFDGSDEAINALLDRDENYVVSAAERNRLSSIGQRQNVVINTMGQRAVAALGLKATKEAGSNEMARLESAVGAHVMKLLVDQGLLTVEEISGAEMKSLTGSQATQKDVRFQFLRLTRDAQNQLAQKSEQIFQATRKSQGLLDKLFGVEPALKEPSLKPVAVSQTTTRNTQQGVPSKLKAIIAHQNSVGNYVRQEMWKLMGSLSEDVRLQIAGAESAGETSHKTKRLAAQAKNDGLRREIDRFLDFVGLMDDPAAALYFDHVVWKQQRVGIATNVINPQSSKVHRHMLYQKSWESKVNFANDAELENFQLRVLEGLGVKTDKQSNASSLGNNSKEFTAKVAEPAIAAAVALLQKNLQGQELTQAEQSTLLAGVKAGGKDMASLDSLMALAQAANARQDGASSVTVYLMGEVDGVTNGPMLTHLLLGAASSVADLFGLLNRGGFYQLGSEHSNYNTWRGDKNAGHFDLYEATTLRMTNFVQRFMDEGIQSFKGKVMMPGAEVARIMAALYVFTGELTDKNGVVKKAGRDIIKTPLTAMVFGSSIGSAVQSMANNFVDSVYSKIEDLASKNLPDAKRLELIGHLNTLLEQSNGKSVSTTLTVAELMEFELSTDQVSALQQTFKNTLGKAVDATMKTDFADFIDKRQQFNTAAQLSFELYNAAYETMRDEMLAQLVKEGKIGSDQNGQAIQSLNAEQEAQLQEKLAALAPLLHTPMSAPKGELKAGLRASKSGKKLSQNSTHKSEVTFGTPVKGEMVWSKKKNAYVNKQSLDTNGFETVETNPGVAMLVMSTHSADSAISHTALDGQEVLNVHDAHGVGLNNFLQTARNLNKATWETLLNYSPAAQVAMTLSRTLNGLAVLAQEGQLSDALVKAVADSIAKMAFDAEVDPRTFLQQTLQDTQTMAYSADQIKLQAMAQMQAVDQYALEDGQYDVSEKDRENAQAKLAELTAEVDAKTLASVQEISALLNKVWADQAAPAKAGDSTNEKPESSKALAGQTSPFGPLGTPKVAPDADLVAFFEANPEASFQRVLQGLLRKVSKDGSIPNQAFNIMLIKTLAKLVNPDFKVKYITSTTSADMPLGVMKGARGWTSISGNQQEIYVLSPEFVDSGLTPEVLIHELVHAALQSVLSRSDAAVQPFVEELNTLLDLSRTYLQQNGLSSKFGAAVTSIDELVSWGMTNKAFQQEVLAKIQLQSRTLGKITNALQAFVATLSRLLGFKDVASANGMGVLIANVSALFDQVAKTQAADRIQTDGVTNLAMASPQTILNTYTTQDLHDALDDQKISSAFSAQIRGVLGSIVEKLHGPYGSFKESLMKDQALSGMDVWLKGLNTGEAPFASEALSSLFVVSNQEAFAIEQVEATVRAALNANEAFSTSAYTVLAKLYNETEKRLTVRDFYSGIWQKATPAEQAQAQALYDFIFKVEAGPGQRSNYLARFAAMGMAHEGFNKLLQVATQRSGVPASQSFASRLQAIFEQILEFFQAKITKTYAGQPAYQKLYTLVDQLVDIEAKRRYVLNHPKRNTYQDSVEDAVRTATEAMRAKVSKAAGSSFIQNNRNAVVRAAGGLVRTVAEDQVDFFMENLRTMRNSAFKGKLGVIASSLGEFKGAAPLLQALLRQSKSNEGQRKDLITNAAKAARNAFINKGKDLSEAANAAISAVFLRTGAYHLAAHFSMAEMADLLSNRAALDKAVATFEAKLAGFGNSKYYFINQANALGLQKATGAVATGFEMTNAHNIANMYGTAYQGKLTAQEIKDATAAIEVLTGLYALGYSNTTHLSEAGQVLAAENQRTDGNGVEFVMKLHQQLEVESLQRLFKGRPELMMHGYVPEIYDPNVDIKTANALEGKELLALGYRKGPQLAPDRADPDRTVQHIYIRDGGGLNPRVTGIVSWKGMNAKGSQQHSGYLNTNTYNGAQNASFNADIMANRQQAIADMFKPGARPDLSQVKANHMLPVLNERGEVVNWRYVMSEATKDALLKRDNRFDQLLGSLAGSIYDKETSREQNKTAIRALKDQYDLDYQKNPEAYIEVGQGVLDKEMKEIWDLLPEESKADVRAIWGTSGLMVRNDALDIMFGYRKKSFADAFEKDPKLRSQLEKVFVAGVQLIMSQGGRVFKGMTPKQAEDFAKQAAYRISKGEDIWQEVVGEVKDIIVVKTGLVMLGNIYSNITLLAMNGVPIKDILHHHLVALKGANAYRRDNDELAQLKLLRDTGYMQGQDVEITRRIIKLEDAIARNPVKELIDAGLMPTIVEDVANDENIYSYKSDFARKTKKYTDKLNPKVLNAAKAVYMAHDTQLYQGLFRITQVSDFVARYTLYQHHIAKKNPMSKAEAIQEASDAFVNYDIPMHRTLQHLDDLGLLPFTKYFLRIQKVLNKLFKEHPARVLMTLSLDQFMNLGPIVLESSMWGRIGNNPLDIGALKLPGVLDDLATVKATMSIFK